MQNNPRKQDIIQELRDKRQDVTELCTEAEAVNEPHTGSGIVTNCLYLNVRKLPDINADVAVVIDALTWMRPRKTFTKFALLMGSRAFV